MIKKDRLVLFNNFKQYDDKNPRVALKSGLKKPFHPRID